MTLSRYFLQSRSYRGLWPRYASLRARRFVKNGADPQLYAKTP